MKLLKNNSKLIIGLIVGVLLSGGIVYAAMSADQVNYTKDGTNIKNVGEALNDLYEKTREIKLGTTYTSKKMDNMKDTLTWSIDLPAGRYLCETNYIFSAGADNLQESQSETSSINIISNKTIEYSEINNLNLTKSGDVKCLWNNGQYLISVDRSKTFLVSSEENFTLTASRSEGWTNSAVPVMMNFKCTEIK